MNERQTPAPGPQPDWTPRFLKGHLLLGWRPKSTAAQPAPVWLTDPEAHTICVGATGSGKGVSALIPTLLTYRGSTVTIDVKGEAYATTARYRRDVLGHRIVRIDPFGIMGRATDTLNPLDILRLMPESMDACARQLPNMLDETDISTRKEPYWDLQGNALLTALISYVMSGLDPEQPQTLSGVYRLVANGDFSYTLATILEKHGKKLPDAARFGFQAFLSISTEITRSCIHSVATQHLAPFADEEVARATATTSFSLEDFRNGVPMAIYLILPPHRLKSHGALLRLWLVTLIELLATRRRRPALATYFLIDEVAHLGHMRIVEDAFTLMRGYGVRVGLFVQDLPKLRKVYPQGWATMLANTSCLQVLRPKNFQVAKELSKYFSPEVSAAELVSCGVDEQYLLYGTGAFAKTRRLFYYEDACFAGRFDDNPLLETYDPEEAGAKASDDNKGPAVPPLNRASRPPLDAPTPPRSGAPKVWEDDEVRVPAWGRPRFEVRMPGRVRDN